MNHLFFPNRPKPVVGKAGINRVRKIIKYEKKQDKNADTPNNNAILHNNIPSSWFYNKNQADKVWNGLEQTEKERQKIKDLAAQKENEEKEQNEQNPFFKIDKSTSKIRQLVDSFGITDQEFLLNLMELLDDDSGIENIDQQSILLEAKLRLAAIIDEHVGNSNAQSRMLDSLREFFNDYQEGNQNAIDKEMSNLSDFDTGVDSAHLANLINDACEKNEVCSEQASHIHKSIVDSFTRQMRDLRQEIDSRDKQIEDLQHQLDSHQKNRRNRRQEIAARKVKEVHQALSGAQRKICEQQTTINNLKSALNGPPGSADSNSQRDGQFSSSPPSGHLIGEKMQNSSFNESNEFENENGSAYLSSDRELELMSKIHYLTEQVQVLKSDLSSTNKELKDLKFSSIDLNSNYQALERSKKTADQTIISLNEKYEFMENMYKKKLGDLESGNKIVGNEKSENQIIADLKIEYENKIASLKEQARQSQQQALDIAEKRHRMQMNDMLKSLENADQSAALSEVMKNQESSINEVSERHKKQISELKNANNDKIRVLTQQYEAKLKDAFKQNDTIRLSLKDDIAASLLKQKIDLEASFQKKLNDTESDHDMKFEQMRKKLQNKIDSVENLNKKLITERDALRDAIEDAQVVVDIPTAEDELFDENEEEEEEFEDNENNNNDNNNNNNENDDVKLFDRNWADQQIKKVKDEYIAMMNQQRENILTTKEWELEQMKREMIRNFDKEMTEKRMNYVSDLTDLRDQVSNSNSTQTEICEQIDNLISNLVKSVEKQAEINEDIVNSEPMISLSEANEKMSELNKKIVEASSENEFLRITLGKLSNNRSLKCDDGNDMVKVMRQSIAEETRRINELLIENGKLKEELEITKNEFNEFQSKNEEMKKNSNEEIELLKKKIEEMKENSNKNEDNSSSSFSGSISLPLKPSFTIEHVSNDDINDDKILCEKCGEKISINPLVLQVSTVEKPIVECPFCHEAVQIEEKDKNSPFQKDEFNNDQLEKIGQMENEIKNEIMNLIEIKKKMREGIDLEDNKQVIKINNQEEKIITLAPSYDLTIFTLPPNPKIQPKKPEKSSPNVANVRAFSPSSNRILSPEQAEKIQQMEEEIDKKITSLVDFKTKSSSRENSSKENRKENFFNSSEKNIEQIQKEIKDSYFVIYDSSASTNKGRMITASQSCNIFQTKGRRVSFSSNLIKPPHNKINLPDNIILQDNISENQIKITSALKSKFVDGYGGTSLDGSQNPFSRPLSELLEEESQTENQQQNSSLPKLNNKVEQNQASPVVSGFPKLQEDSTRKSPLMLQDTKPKKNPILSRSKIKTIDIIPVQKTKPVENAHVERGGDVFARIQSQLMRSQQQIPQQPQPEQQEQQKNQQEKTTTTPTPTNQNKNQTFLTPEADIVSLQLSDVGYFSIRNSRPNSELQQRSSRSSRNDNNNNDDDGDNDGDKLFKNGRPIGEPRAIEEFVEDLNSWRREMSELKEQYKSMSNSYNEVSSMTHDLVQRHNEVVKVLTKALDTAMSLAHGDAEHPEALIEKMQEQSAYLTTAIREKEILHSQSNEHLLALNERVQEVMQMHGESSEKDHEIENLQKQLRVVTEKEKQHVQQIHAFEQSEKTFKENSDFMKEQLNSMADKLEIECKKNFELTKEADATLVKIEQLQTELVLASKDPEIDMTAIEPFVIFSIDQSSSENSNNKSKGFGLQPKLSSNLSSMKSLPLDEIESNKPDSNQKEIVVDNEVIHVSSFKKSESKSQENSSGSFSVFQPEISENSESKMVYKALSQNEENIDQSSQNLNEPSEKVEPSDSNGNPPSIEKVELAVSHAPIIGGTIVESQKAQNLKKRIKQLESTLVEKHNENSEVKEELHTTQQHLFKLTNLNAKIEREMKKVETSREIALKKLQASMELVTSLSTENESLRKLVDQYKQMAKKFAEDMKKASQFEESKNMALLNEMKTRALLCDIQKVDHSKYSWKNIAERQAFQLARWEGKRRFMQQREKQKIISALQALNLVKIDEQKGKIMDENETDRSENDNTPDNNLKRKRSIAPGLNIAVYNLKKKSEMESSQILDPNLVLDTDRPRSVPSYDEALKNANSHNQKVPKALKLGIVANPLKI